MRWIAIRYLTGAALAALLAPILTAADITGTAVPAAGIEVDYDWPTSHPVELVKAYDPPLQPWQRGHRGVDLRQPTGSPVFAMAPGQVSTAGEIAGKQVVAITHADGIRTTYELVEPCVSVGEMVSGGDRIGTQISSVLNLGAKVSADEYRNPLALIYGYPVLNE
ncbi:MAG: M23 family metallopeptidase [Varibaculum sp.]|nr:M23 family metallopeptidase [Varibaculum sp.]